MLHLSIEKFEKIDKIANQIAELKPGCRERQKTYAAELKRLVKAYAATATKPPKSYQIVYLSRENLGNKKYSDMADKINFLTVSKIDTVRETEKSIIIEHRYFKDIILKEKILVYIW